MTAQEKDRIESAIRHIQTAVDVDPWAIEIAVKAMKTQLSAEGTTSDLISRQDAIDAVKDADVCVFYSDNQSIDDVLDYTIRATKGSVIASIEQLPSTQPEIIRCKDCKHFELDHFEKVEEFPVPIIVAHEICMKWSDGCRTSKDGWCFMGERRTDE